jgi:hypothetical protein
LPPSNLRICGPKSSYTYEIELKREWLRDDYVVGIEMHDMRSRFTPSINDITKAERIFSDKYNEVQKTNVDTKSYFSHWVRQYVGLVDSNGNKNIIVQLIDDTKKRKMIRKLGKNWETSFVIIFADPNPELGIIFRINIDTGNMTMNL